MRSMIVHELGLMMGGRFSVLLHVGGIIRHVAYNPRGELNLWEECDPRQGQRGRDFIVVETGDPILDGAQYVGTVWVPPHLHHQGAFSTAMAAHVYMLAE